MNKKNIFFIGVFDKDMKSTNTSQLMSLREIGHRVTEYNYRKIAKKIGPNKRDLDMVSLVKKHNFDLVIYSKCNRVSLNAFKEINKITKTCMWFMDPISNYGKEMINITKEVDYFCCDKKNVLAAALKINKNSFYVCEGYNQYVDKPHNIKKQYDVSFIGNIYGYRQKMINKIETPVKVISNAYGLKHSIEVSKSKINLNFCTRNGASDRVYKILAAKGFLLTNDWDGRGDAFVDKKDLVIFKDERDLNNKINFYLKNTKLMKEISLNGFKSVKKFDRISWAKKITNLLN